MLQSNCAGPNHVLSLKQTGLSGLVLRSSKNKKRKHKNLNSGGREESFRFHVKSIANKSSFCP